MLFQRTQIRIKTKTFTIGLLQQTITWYKIRHAGGQAPLLFQQWVVGRGNMQSRGLLGRVMYGGKLTFPGRYGSHEGLPGPTLKRAG